MAPTTGTGRASPSPRATALLVSGMAVFGTATPVSRIVGRGFPTLLAAGLRIATAAAVLVPVAWVVAERAGTRPLARLRGLTRRDWAWLGAIAAVGTFGFSVLMVLGMRRAPGSVGAVVMATTPAVTALGATLVFRERLTRPRLLALGLGVAGVVVVNLTATASSGGDDVLLGSVLVFGAVCCEAVYTLAGKRMGAELDPLTTSTAAALLSLPLFAPFVVAFALGHDWSQASGGQWLALLWWGVGTMALGSVLWFRGLRAVEGSVAAVHMAVMPVSALLGAYVLLGEPFDPWDVVGMAAVVAGMALVHREGSARGPPPRLAS